MHKALRALPGMGPASPRPPRGPQINKSMGGGGGGTWSPNLPAPVSSSEGVRRRRAFLTLFMAGRGWGEGQGGH